MKKLFILSFSLLMFGIYLPRAQAFTVSSGPTAPEIKTRYSGSVIIEDNHFTPSYWYVEPESQTRYLLNDGKSVSQLLKNLGLGIANKDLAKIPTSTESLNVDYELTHNMRGKFLLQVEENGEAWYVNPLDNLRYSIANGKEGLKTLQKLGIEVDDVKMRAIPITKELGFSQTKSDSINFDMYNMLKDTLKNNYYKPEVIEDKDLFYGSLEGMAGAIGDPYTQFYTPREKRIFDNALEGSVEGIGAIVETIGEWLNIISPLDGSPAEKAGLLPQDRVLKVDDINIKGWPTEDSTSLIKGASGTDVVLEIYRPSEDKTFKVTITRERIEIDNVAGKIIDNNIAYFKINLFSDNAVSEFAKIKNKIVDDATRGIIVDLRNNPGGYTYSAMNIADYWLEPGDVVLQEQYRDKHLSYKASTEPSLRLPTIILINEGTASASEIFTLALDDYELSQIVGHQSFGKGSGQTIEQFNDGSGIKYTIMEWSGPLGNSIAGVGIEPDYVIDNDSKTDYQLQKARDLLK